MNKLLKKYFCLLFISGILGICAVTFLLPILTSAETGDSSPIFPIITAITPSTIYTDDEVEITGRNFGDVQGVYDKVKLSYSGIVSNLKIIKWSDTKIVIKINDNGAYLFSPIFLSVYHEHFDPNFGVYNQASPESEPFQVKILSTFCKENTWSCIDDWTSCSYDGTQTRTCYKNSSCNESNAPSPTTSQSCTPPPKPITPVILPPVYQPPQPSCTADTWTCGDWNSCSLSGTQSRNCTKTFDCPDVQTAAPSTDQYCEVQNKPVQQAPQDNSSEISNQDLIIKSTVKLICPLDEKRASQGSGTVIDSSGTILTNKHVIEGTLGCLVGFINDFNDEPYFGDRQIADILKISSNEDVALVKIRNPQNRQLQYIDITSGNSSNLRLGAKILTYGYPAKFGTNITYTSGDFSGTNGSYLKTTAIIEHGNSGGGAYSKDGIFIGIPSAVIKGELNALGYVLSIKTINNWLGNTAIVYNNKTSNDYSRVSSVLENIDLKKLGSLELVVPGKINDKTTPIIDQRQTKTTKQTSSVQLQKQNKIISSSTTPIKSNQEINHSVSSVAVQSERQSKPSWTKRFVSRFISWFK